MKIADGWISEQSHIVIDGAGPEAVGFHLAIERKLSSIGDPEITWRMESGETGFVRALLGKRRDLLVIRHENFSEYNVLVAARAHGSALHVSMMVLCEPRLAKDLRRALQFNVDRAERFDVGAELDAIDLMDLQAFLGIARLAFRDAIRSLTDREPEDDEDSGFRPVE